MLLAPSDLTAADPTLIDDLTADFGSLTNLHPLPGSLETRVMSFRDYLRLREAVRTGNPDLQAAMDRFAQRIRAEYGANIVQGTFAFTLTNALAGKPIPAATARRLAVMIIGAFDNAERCERQHTVLPARGIC
jgi:hypothetical protein